jgi:HK97 family phage prohead protease
LLNKTIKENKMSEKEVRSITIPAEVEIRADGTPGAIYGYPIVYNKDSEDMGFIERIAPGAATKALKKSDIRALKNHDPNLIFGRLGVNLKFSEDKNGVRYEATPINTRTFQETAEEVRLGLLTGQSFGFTILADKWEGLDTDKPIRTITEIGRIYDVGPVTYPAYQDTSVALRSLEKAKKQKDEAFTEPLINIILGWEEGDNLFSLNEIDRAIEYLNSLRSDLSPTTDESDNADDVPTNTKSSDDGKEFMERLNKTLKKYDEVK